MRFLDRLNTPMAFVLVLVIFLVADGLLLYRYQANLGTRDAMPSAPSEQSAVRAGVTTSETTASEGTAADSDRSERPTLQRTLQECDAEERECVLRFTSERAPQAQYVHERSLIDESGRERNVLYFSDPSQRVCEFRRFEGTSSEAAPVYVVIIAGESSFDDQYAEGEVGCLPEF